MNRGISFHKRFLLIIVVILMMFSATPGLVFAETPPMSPSQQARAGRLQKEYDKLKTDLNDLGTKYDQADGYRSTYVRFMQGQKGDTAILQSHLNIFDNAYKLGAAARKAGLAALSDTSGFDTTHAIINNDVVESHILSALASYLTARNYLVSAVYNLHSGLDTYALAKAVSVPDIPKMHFDPYYLAAALSSSTPPTLTAKQQREAGTLKGKAANLSKDLNDLGNLYDLAARYRQSYVSFLNGEQKSKHNTKVLETELPVFDSYLSLGSAARGRAIAALANRPGQDVMGNVIDLNALDNAVRTSLNEFLTARNYLVMAINEMHSGLNLYHQVSGLDTPDVPKIHLPPYVLTD